MDEKEEQELMSIINSASNPIFSDSRMVSELRKGLDPKMKSNFSRVLGRVEHPIIMANAVALMDAVNIQETCIRAKRDATVGLGFETEEERDGRRKERELSERSHEIAMAPPGSKEGPAADKPKEAPTEKAHEEEPSEEPEGDGSEIELSKAEKVLDPLCGQGDTQNLLDMIGEDYENTGNGYIEVVRDGEEIVAMWHMPAACVYVFNEEEAPHYHYEVDGDTTLRYAKFGDLEGFKERNSDIDQELVTELIHFRMPTSKSREYGLPSWLSCVPWLELAQKVMQYDFDYFDNRAVPDLMVLITGAALQPAAREALKDSLKSTIGAGNRHRTLTVNIPEPEAKIQVERLNADNRERFNDQWANIQLQVVSTHRVPPVLAGVVIPGKMAASNELPNALVAFQSLYIAQQQKNISKTLGRTLGNPEESGLDLTAEDFRFKQITDFYDMGQMDTMSRMRETSIEASQSGRKLEDGLKD